MRILLINPLVEHEMRGPHPMKAEDMAVFPHLGLMYLASALLEDGGFDVKLMDMTLEKNSGADLENTLRSFNPSVVGLTSFTDCLYDFKLTVQTIRNVLPEVFICVGGPHVEIFPKETLDNFPINAIVRGDGEYSFRELCRRLREGKPWGDIDGVGYKSEGKIVQNPQWQVDSLNELPFPARQLSSMDKVRSAVAKGEAITSVCSSRGCPLPCTFCNSPYKKYRLRSAQNVLAEIRECHEKLGIGEFYFFDDLFNISKQRVLEMCDAFDKLPYRVKWSFRGRVNNLDFETLKRCKEAGCNRVHFGVESGTERILRIYKKGLKPARVKEIFKICHDIKLESVANFIIGAPTETREEINKTIKFIWEIDPDFLEFHVLIPYPYTAIYQDMLKSGRLKKDVWTEHAINPQPGFHPPLANEIISEEELFSILSKVYKKFYFRPSFLINQLKTVAGFKDFCGKAWSAFRLLSVTRS